MSPKEFEPSRWSTTALVYYGVLLHTPVSNPTRSYYIFQDLSPRGLNNIPGFKPYIVLLHIPGFKTYIITYYNTQALRGLTTYYRIQNLQSYFIFHVSKFTLHISGFKTFGILLQIALFKPYVGLTAYSRIQVNLVVRGSKIMIAQVTSTHCLTTQEEYTEYHYLQSSNFI